LNEFVDCGYRPAAHSGAPQKITDADAFSLTPGTCSGFKGKGRAIGDVFLDNGGRQSRPTHSIRLLFRTGWDCWRETSWIWRNSRNNIISSAVFATGNSLRTDEDVNMLANDASQRQGYGNGGHCVGCVHDMPFMGVKVVTGIVDSDQPTPRTIHGKLHAASVSLQEALPRFWNIFWAKHHHELKFSIRQAMVRSGCCERTRLFGIFTTYQ
jgi:hypothetical protein